MMSGDIFKIVFLGTPTFAVPVLKKLIDNDLKPFLVVTQPDKPVGRKQELTPSPIKQLAMEAGIQVAQPDTKDDLATVLKELEIDVCVLVAYGMIIPEEALNIPKAGFVNLHPSKLPKYRGPSPIQAAILNGDSQTAVTIIKLDADMDSGPIIAQQDMAIEDTDNYSSLSDKLSEVGAELMVEILPDYITGTMKLSDQDDALATYCSLVKRDDGQVNWSKSAIQIHRQFKAFSHWPGVFTYLDKKRLKIANLDVLEGDFPASQRGEGINLALGEVFLGHTDQLAVRCDSGSISLMRVQLEGKNEISGQEFLQGHKNIVGKILG